VLAAIVYARPHHTKTYTECVRLNLPLQRPKPSIVISRFARAQVLGRAFPGVFSMVQKTSNRYAAATEPWIPLKASLCGLTGRLICQNVVQLLRRFVLTPQRL
jgi:hypothetical protein